jgi:microcystin-dependent protein
MLSNQEIMMLIMLILIFYLLYKTHSIQENFSVSDDVKQAINDIYKADINAIRNLSNVATDIYNNNDSLTIPAKITTIADLTVTGNVLFTNKNNNMIEILPTGMVIAWALSTLPKGWALCDGQKYKLDNNNNTILDINGTQTPDLRGRFILGSGQGTNLTNRNLNSTGGEEKHLLTVEEMPSHNHSSEGFVKWGGYNIAYSAGGGNINGSSQIGNTGGSQPHNIMPPFYVLTYIMKL